MHGHKSHIPVVTHSSSQVPQRDGQIKRVVDSLFCDESAEEIVEERGEQEAEEAVEEIKCWSSETRKKKVWSFFIPQVAHSSSALETGIKVRINFTVDYHFRPQHLGTFSSH